MCKLFKASSRISGGGREWKDLHRNHQFKVQRSLAQEVVAEDPGLVYCRSFSSSFSFSASTFSKSSDGESGVLLEVYLRTELHSAMSEGLVDDARRFHVRVLRRGV